MQKIAVVFDMDGVLFDTERLLMDCFHQALTERKLPFRPEVYLRTLGTNCEDTVAIYNDGYPGLGLGSALLERVVALSRARIDAEGPPLKPGAVEIVEFLHKRGCLLALASSNRRAYIESELAAVGLLRYFQAVMSGDEVARSKPDPEIYRRAFALLGAPEAAGYAVEDSPAGIRSAHAAGLKPILVPDLLVPEDAVRALAHKEFPSLMEACAYFASIL